MEFKQTCLIMNIGLLIFKITLQEFDHYALFYRILGPMRKRNMSILSKVDLKYNLLADCVREVK